ncbi:MAG: hypothetical protein ACEPO2_19005 [Pelagibaca sp.]
MCDSDDWTVQKSKSAKKKDRYKVPETSGSSEHKTLQEKFLQTAISQAESVYKTRRGALQEGKVGCAMFYLVNDQELTFLYDTSHSDRGKRANLRALRDVSKVARDKLTVCAEEHIIAENPDKVFLFSLAFRHDRVIPPCSNRKGAGKGGCSLLLASRNILDLSKHL